MSVAVDETPKSGRPAAIFAALKQRILQWEYPPAYRFMEDEISREFGVSRSPVREALRMLEESGLIERTPHRGCTVKQPNLQAITELYDVRIMLETAAVELVAAHGMPAAELDRLTATWTALAQTPLAAPVESTTLATQDRDFHEALAAATGNRTLVELLQTINDRLHFVRLIDITTAERLLETCQQHLAILEQIAARDPQAARSAIQHNIEGARAHVGHALKEALARSYFAQSER